MARPLAPVALIRLLQTEAHTGMTRVSVSSRAGSAKYKPVFDVDTEVIAAPDRGELISSERYGELRTIADFAAELWDELCNDADSISPPVTAVDFEFVVEPSKARLARHYRTTPRTNANDGFTALLRSNDTLTQRIVEQATDTRDHTVDFQGALTVQAAEALNSQAHSFSMLRDAQEERHRTEVETIKAEAAREKAKPFLESEFYKDICKPFLTEVAGPVGKVFGGAIARVGKIADNKLDTYVIRSGAETAKVQRETEQQAVQAPSKESQPT